MSVPVPNPHVFPTPEGAAVGICLRDYFAAFALAGLLTRERLTREEAGMLAYTYADAMLEARGRETEEAPHP